MFKKKDQFDTKELFDKKERYLRKKLAQSATNISQKNRNPAYLQNTKVNTCNHIIMNNGSPLAIYWELPRISEQNRKEREWQASPPEPEDPLRYRRTFQKHRAPSAYLPKKNKTIELTKHGSQSNYIKNMGYPSDHQQSPFYDQVNIYEKFSDKIVRAKSKNMMITEYKKIGNFCQDYNNFTHPEVKKRMATWHKHKQDWL